MLHFALDAPCIGWRAWLRRDLPAGDAMTFARCALRGTYRAAVLRNGRLEALLFVGAEPEAALP